MCYSCPLTQSEQQSFRGGCSSRSATQSLLKADLAILARLKCQSLSATKTKFVFCVTSVIKEKDAPAYLYGDLKREELLRTGSVVLHEKYFANLGGSGKADGQALKLIEQWFGSYENWEIEFRKNGSTSGRRFGMGNAGL